MGQKPFWILPNLDLPFFTATTTLSSPPELPTAAAAAAISISESQHQPLPKPIFSFPPPSQPVLLPKTYITLSALVASVTRCVRSITSLLPFSTPSAPRRLTVSRPVAGCAVPLFRPYVAQVPWHGGVRRLLSQLFPRYGHYCGPNWSSGKDGGSMLWDRRPIDWLDFCCYCHDIGYDTHDQAKLLRADLAFLECLEKPRMATKGGAYSALVYRAMCIAGLRSILIPYRTLLIRLQNGPLIFENLSTFIGKVTCSCGMLKTRKSCCD